jgi:hypothetical protein
MKIQRVNHQFRWRLALVLAVSALLILAVPAQTAPADRSTNFVFDIDTFEPIDGSVSRMVRTDHSLSMTIRTSGLEPGHTYTIWWVVFNHPDECITAPGETVQCGEPDVIAEFMGESDAGVTLAPATGNVVGTSGHGNFGASLRVGDDRDVILGGPLSNPREAEVHLVVRDHGPMNPAWMPDQIHTFGGGCDQADPGYPPPLVGQGVAGDFACVEPQFTFHVVD